MQFLLYTACPFLLSVVKEPIGASAGSCVVEELLEVMPSFQQQGQGYKSHHGGYFPMNSTRGEFQNFSTTDEDADYGTQAPSDVGAHSWMYPESPTLRMEYESQGLQNESVVPDNGNVASPDGSLDTESFTVNQYLTMQEPWNPVGPSRQNNVPMDPQVWEQLPGNDVLTGHYQGPWDQQPLNNGYSGYNTARQVPQVHGSLFDAAAPIFTGYPNATGDFLEQNPGLRTQDCGKARYSPNLDICLDAEYTPNATASHRQLDPDSTQNRSFVCTTCGMQFKSNTALKKCVARHEKPHLCPIVGCKKNKDGFATINDADRHCDSVHQQDLYGNPRPPRFCPWKGCNKTFPQTRNDNLKQHLVKIHHVPEKSAQNLVATLAPSSTSSHRRTNRFLATPGIEDYTIHEALEQGSDSAPSLGYGSLQPSSQSNEVSDGCHRSQFQSVHTSMNCEAYPGNSFCQASDHSADFPHPMLASRHIVQTTATPAMESQSWPPNSILSSYQAGAGISLQGDLNDTSSFSTVPSLYEKMDMQNHCQIRSETQLGTPQKIVENVLGGLRSEKPRSSSHSSSAFLKPPLQAHAAAPERIYSPMDEAPHSSVQSSNSVEAVKIVHALEARYDLVEKGSTCATNIPSNMSSPAGSPAIPHPSGCKNCIKYHDSPCLLRKHLKREAQPYFCTDDQCQRHFGSKNDQMRHHNSQHVNLEKWRCGIHENGHTCSMDFNHPASLQNHLTGKHGIIAYEVKAKGLVKQMRIINQDYPREFWCGICGYWLGLAGEAEARRDLLFNHIEDHLEARNGEQTGEAEDWRPQPHGNPQPVERNLKCKTSTRQGASSRNRLKSEPPIEIKTPSRRGNMRPQLAKTSNSADNKRHPASPLLRPQMGSKRLKSDSELRQKGKEGEGGGTRSRKGEVIVSTVTYTCCQCSNFGAAVTGWCDCGHQYNLCCESQVVRQPGDEFQASRGGGLAMNADYGGRGHSRYQGFDSRST